MNLTDLILYFFVGIVVIAALILAWTNNIVHASFAFLFVLLGIAALFVYAGAEFIGVIQIMIYVGGVLVLIIFGVMLTPKYKSLGDYKKRYANISAAVFCCCIVGGLIYSFTLIKIDGKIITQNPKLLKMTNPQTIGYELLTEYMLPFEISSILLLVALIGAATVATNKLTTKIDK